MDGLRPSLDPLADGATAVADGTGTASMGSLEERVGHDASRSDRLISRAPSATSTDVARLPHDAEADVGARALKGTAVRSGSRTRPRSLRMRNWLIDRVVAFFALLIFAVSFLYRGE